MLFLCHCVSTCSGRYWMNIYFSFSYRIDRFNFPLGSPVVNHIQVFQIPKTRILHFGRIMVFLFTKYIVKATHVFWVRAYACVWANGVMTFLNNIRSSSTHVKMLELHNFLALKCITYLKYDSNFCCTFKRKDLLSHIWNRWQYVHSILVQ